LVIVPSDAGALMGDAVDLVEYWTKQSS
jgi:hypothetical protein